MLQQTSSLDTNRKQNLAHASNRQSQSRAQHVQTGKANVSMFDKRKPWPSSSSKECAGPANGTHALTLLMVDMLYALVNIGTARLVVATQ